MRPFGAPACPPRRRRRRGFGRDLSDAPPWSAAPPRGRSRSCGASSHSLLCSNRAGSTRTGSWPSRRSKREHPPQPSMRA